MTRLNARLFFLGILTLTGLASAQLGTREDWTCGNVNLDQNGHIIDDMDSWLTGHVVNDRFPPNEYLTGFVVPTIAAPDIVWAQRNCTPIGVAEWSPACLEHDQCMDAKGTQGVSSEQCNQNILTGWQRSCSSAYRLTSQEADLVYGRTATSWGAMDMWAKIGIKIACYNSCSNMAELSQKAMLLGMTRTFPALAVPPVVTAPVVEKTPTPLDVFAFHTRVIGMASDWPVVKSAWDAPDRRYEFEFRENIPIHGVINGVPIDPDEEMVFSSQPVGGSFILESRVTYGTMFSTGSATYNAYGLMLRNGFERKARFYKVFTNSNATEITVRYRTIDNGPVVESKTTVTTAPARTLRIRKSGNNVVAFYLDPSSKWVQLEGANISWGATIPAGLFTDFKTVRNTDNDSWYFEARASFVRSSLKKYVDPTPVITALLVH